MLSITRMLMKQVPRWDRPTQAALGIALVLLVGMIGVVIFGGEALRIPAIVGVGTLFLVVQVIALWGNRELVTPFTQAQRLYLDGGIRAALDVLQAECDTLDMQGLTLLGNIQRQLGDLDASEAALQAALDDSPGHHFPLVGLGRTQMAQGRYEDAQTCFKQALSGAGLPVVRYDLAEAYYRAGELSLALDELDAVPRPEHARPEQVAGPRTEPYRLLLADWLAYRFGDREPPTNERLFAGLPYWEAAAERFAHTPYGAAVAADVQAMRDLAYVPQLMRRSDFHRSQRVISNAEQKK